MKFIVEMLKTVAVILITAVVMLIIPIGVIMVFISGVLFELKLIRVVR
jgi:hypothetical protein